MSMDRKSFLKISGCALASAFAGKELFQIVEAQDGATAQFPDAKQAKRWGMVVDTRKCLKADGCDKCMTACHQTHNVPDIENKAHEVKWIWKESYEHAFAKETKYPSEVLEHRDLLVFPSRVDRLQWKAKAQAPVRLLEDLDRACVQKECVRDLDQRLHVA